MDLLAVKKFLLDYLFPIFCVGCQKEGEWWCENCLKKDFRGGQFSCPLCHLPTSAGRPCAVCAPHSFLDGVAAFYEYHDQKPIGGLIKNFKYQLATDIVSVWEVVSKLYLDLIFRQAIYFNQSYLLLPIPLHYKREAERGFNQAQMIAETFLKFLPKSEFDVRHQVLSRIKNTPKQSQLSKEERQKNILGAFEYRGLPLNNQSIILVDDVYTTGATMQECARVLKNNGAKAVYGLALARG
jgi:ComF family protein